MTATPNRIHRVAPSAWMGRPGLRVVDALCTVMPPIPGSIETLLMDFLIKSQKTCLLWLTNPGNFCIIPDEHGELSEWSKVQHSKSSAA